MKLYIVSGKESQKTTVNDQKRSLLKFVEKLKEIVPTAYKESVIRTEKEN